MDVDRDFSRPTWCLLGLPFDAIDLERACAEVLDAAQAGRRCFLSTPNLTFLCAAQDDAAFRRSVIHSDLSVADGFPIVLMAKWLRIPLAERIAGSDLIEHLHRRKTDRPLRVFFFGGEPGVGEKASRNVNAQRGGLESVGNFDPGFVGVDQMSSPDIIANLNRHEVDFLIVSLGAKKGQAWIQKNLSSLRAPVVSHLGAVINFFAGTVARAPVMWQKVGLEWLWRIFQEPKLWRRYFDDGIRMVRLVFGNVLPYALWLRRHASRHEVAPLDVQHRDSPDGGTVITLAGDAVDAHLTPLRKAFGAAASGRGDVTLDLSRVRIIDSAFLGSCLMLTKHLDVGARRLRLRDAGPTVRRILAWQRMDYLLD
jgi:N-acetylglucosaminyldiphosphoundecaprenol N-acetyl-beta-D-mannosaminyltransferase